MDLKRKKIYWAVPYLLKDRSLKWLQANTESKIEYEPNKTRAITELSIALISYGWFWCWISEGSDTKQPVYHLEINEFLKTFSRDQPLSILLSTREEAIKDVYLLGHLWGARGHGLELLPENNELSPFLQWYTDSRWGFIELVELTRLHPFPIVKRGLLSFDQRVFPMDELRTPLKCSEYIADAVIMYDCTVIYHRPQRGTKNMQEEPASRPVP